MRSYLSPSALIACLIIAGAETWFWCATDSLSGSPLFEPTADVGTVMAKRSMLCDGGGKVLLVGDSSCMMGLIPDLIAERPDGCLNLGTLSSFTLAGVEALVSEAALLEPRPRAIIVAVLPQTLAVSREQAREFGLLGPYLVAYGQSCAAYSPCIDDWHKWVFRKHQLGRFPAEFGGAYAVFHERLLSTGGYFEEPGHYAGTDQPRESVVLSDFSRLSALAIAATCRRHEIPLVFWLSPVPRDSVSDEYITDTARIAKELSIGDEVILGREAAPAWDAVLFGSVTHLTRQGAEKNSAELAACLRAIRIPENFDHQTSGRISRVMPSQQ